MQAGTGRLVLLAVAAALASGGTAVTPTAAKSRIPKEPEPTTGARAKPRPAPIRRPASGVVTIGWSERYGLVIYEPVNGGVPFG